MSYSVLAIGAVDWRRRRHRRDSDGTASLTDVPVPRRPGRHGRLIPRARAGRVRPRAPRSSRTRHMRDLSHHSPPRSPSPAWRSRSSSAASHRRERSRRWCTARRHIVRSSVRVVAERHPNDQRAHRDGQPRGADRSNSSNGATGPTRSASASAPAWSSCCAAHGQYTGQHRRSRARAGRSREDLGRTSPDDPLAPAGARPRARRLSPLRRGAGRPRSARPSSARRRRRRGHARRIYQALGRYDEALVIRRMQRRSATRTRTRSAALASVQAQRGDIDEAARIFAEARWSYRDVSPFPLAFLLFDEGAMWMRHGDLGRARALFESALRRLPRYAAARCHLAEVDAALGAHRYGHRAARAAGADRRRSARPPRTRWRAS